MPVYGVYAYVCDDGTVKTHLESSTKQKRIKRKKAAGNGRTVKIITL